MPDLKLLLSTSSLFLFPAAIAAVALSIFAYRHTVPPIPTTKRYFLVVLRSLSLFLLLFLLLEPILRLVRRESKPPTVALLIDDSKSMSLTDKTGNRAEATRSLVKGSWLDRVSHLGRTKFYHFGEGLSDLDSPDSLTFRGGSTDISAALKKLHERSEEENIQAVVLVTDGNYNVGENPLYEVARLGMPIFTVGMGDSAEQKDLLITKAITNEITYAESRVPMDVTVKSSGFNGERVEVSLSEGGKTLVQQFLTLKEGTWEYPAKFFFEPKEDGVKRYTVSVSKLEGELTGANNSKSVFVKVLKSKMKVLLVAGPPSSDVAFIRRALVEDKNVELKVVIEKNSTEFYEGDFSASTLSNAECIVLVGFPLPDSRDDLLRALQAEVQQRGKPLFVLLSRNVDPRKLGAFDAVLPFTAGLERSDELSLFLHVPERQRTHPVMKLSSASNLWDVLPPIYKSGTTFRSKPEAEVLAFVRLQDVTLNEPLLISRNLAGAKSIAFLGYGVWRWKLLAQVADPSSDVLQAFISNSIRWLTTREEAKQVKITPAKEIYTGGEPVEFVAQVYDKTYQPVEAAEVKVGVKKDGETLETILTPLGNGRYEGKFDGLGEGDYEFSGAATSAGERLGEERGKFSVGAQEVEFQETRMNKSLLEQIAYQSGGKYFDPQNISQLADELPRSTRLRPKELTHASEFELWSLPIILTLIVVLFGVEWFIRKQSGML